MASVFLSYCRESQDKVTSLAQDLEAMGHQVWLDQALTGGQAWWNHILNEIAKCDVFAFALDPESLESSPCKVEYTYAAKLGKSVLPVLVMEGVNLDRLPAALAEIQYVDYRREDREAFRALARAINRLPPSPPLPDPLPPPPPAPVSYLAGLRERVEGPEGLSFEEQTGVVARLKHALREPKQADDVRSLLRQFRSREDLFARVADEIDALLAGASVPSVALPPAAKPAPPTSPTRKVSDPVVAAEPKVPKSDERPVTMDGPPAISGELPEALSFKQVWISLIGGLLIAGLLDKVMVSLDYYDLPLVGYLSKLIFRPSWSLVAGVLLCITVVWRKMAFRPLYKKLIVIVLPLLFGFLIPWSRMRFWELGFSGALLSLLFVIAVLWHGTRSKPVPLKIALIPIGASAAVLIVFQLNPDEYFPVVRAFELLVGIAWLVCLLVMLGRFLGTRARTPADS